MWGHRHPQWETAWREAAAWIVACGGRGRFLEETKEAGENGQDEQ